MPIPKEAVTLCELAISSQTTVVQSSKGPLLGAMAGNDSSSAFSRSPKESVLKSSPPPRGS